MSIQETGPTTPRAVTGVAAGVPFVAVPPDGGGPAAPVVVAWHPMDPPRTESALAAALPMAGLPAWRLYLGLPLCGSRLPRGGFEELMRLGFEDAVLNLQGPITHQAADEFGPALAELRERLDLDAGPLAVVGGSAGAAVATLVLAEGDVDVAAAVLVSPLIDLRRAVEAMSRQFGTAYAWTPRAVEVARRLDFVARADEVGEGAPAVLLVVGEDDDPAFLEPATALRDALTDRYADADRVELAVVPGMGHAFAEEPGLEPAPQTAAAGAVDRLARNWLRRHLSRA